ncbi:helix-turn-helix transcriptional regulator [Paenibacillus hexagrammi]|uniref:AraC family transcriptional regulator n=1 Tax=Paenibacillus hexagrammi TaxID=2908839 RepID=A0ABY3SLE0_9BACL|nr:AraC family transcriptional regulator [Paenibacillus sp. YPD9-1]UJF34882.1 AraC family transcriptional regulator [Paenibacillus sp. YPD9-1]
MLQFICPPMPHYIVCGEDTYPVGGKHPNRSNIGVFDLLLVTRGCLYLEENGVTYTVPANHYLILLPDQTHNTLQACRDQSHFYWLHFQTLGLWYETDNPQPVALEAEKLQYERIAYFSSYLTRTGHLKDPEIVYAQLKQLLLLQGEPSSLSQWKQQQLFHDLLLHLREDDGLPMNQPHLRVAEQSAAFLRTHYKEAISYKELSEELHFHSNYIALCMKEAFGCTPLEYVTKYRLEQAKLLLIHTDDPISKIADETGFGSFPYFIRCFNKHVGCTPKAFRMQYRSK